MRVDQRREHRGVRLVEETLDRDVDRLGIRQVGVAVGHRQLRRLDREVGPRGSASAIRSERSWFRLELLEDVEQLERDDARRIGRVGRDPHATIGRGDRLAPGRGMVPEVGRATGNAELGQERGLSLAELAVVERVEAVVGKAPERPGKGREADELAGSPCPAVRPIRREEWRVRADSFCNGARAPLDRVDQLAPGRKAASRQLDRRTEDLRHGQATEPAMRVAPRPDGSRNGHRARSADGHDPEALAPELGRVSTARRPARAVQRQLQALAVAAAACVPDQPERVAADPARIRCTTPSAALAAIAASTAWPPARSMASPASEAR